MDTTQTGTQPAPAPGAEPALILTHEAQTYLRETAKWASFLSIIGFIFCLLILIMAVLVGTTSVIMSRMMPGGGLPAGITGSFVTVFYILIDVLYFFFPYYLYRFASRIKKGIIFQDVAHVTRATESLKSFFKLWGIVTAIVVVIYVIIFLFVIAVGVGTHVIHG